MTRVVADLGNSRLKWGRLAPGGTLAESIALPLDDESAWHPAADRWGLLNGPSEWAISTVNPPLAERLARLLATIQTTSIHWLRAAADVPVAHTLVGAETGGSDRALAVFEALARQRTGPGIVVMCGTAITVERIGPDGVWHGGAIAPGFTIGARALHVHTAQLPLIVPETPPPPWGTGTESSLAAGLFWGMVGSIRELVTRIRAGLEPDPWVVWTGGDAARFAPWVTGAASIVAPDLVLEGLARAAFGSAHASAP